MRPSFELPSWLARLPEVPPTPVRAHRPPTESVVVRALRNPRLPFHVALLAVALGIGAAAASGSVRAKDAAESHAEMSAFATRKVAELRAFGLLRTRASRTTSPLAVGGSLTDDLPGYFDVVEGTEGRQFRRRWTVDSGARGHRRVVVRVIPEGREAGNPPVDIETVLTHP